LVGKHRVKEYTVISARRWDYSTRQYFLFKNMTMANFLLQERDHGNVYSSWIWSQQIILFMNVTATNFHLHEWGHMKFSVHRCDNGKFSCAWVWSLFFFDQYFDHIGIYFFIHESGHRKFTLYNSCSNPSSLVLYHVFYHLRQFPLCNHSQVQHYAVRCIRVFAILYNQYNCSWQTTLRTSVEWFMLHCCLLFGAGYVRHKHAASGPTAGSGPWYHVQKQF
jgi:hypothetical protein